ncbi:protein phosphatase 1 regulatory subunit 14C isoform X3 [Alligator sinensis]|uniref:Protein phosphatase 1 regulatory subunit 14C isoform X3 n=1 Tax=Alligator sinensis TaxID=38654 RepID=A0A3Q0HC84_ALLSI|nr:protein phosphatase 1 regulatory subunit 14C isoform X3 [Alligator sinensis]
MQAFCAFMLHLVLVTVHPIGRPQAREEEMPDVEIDIDDLLDAANEEERALKLQETLVDCYKPTEEFIKELLTRIRGMRKLSPPQKKTI